MGKKRYALVGVSNRGVYFFMNPILTTYSRYAELVALLDSDKTRMDWANRQADANIPTYLPNEFDKMIKDTQPDTIIVACRDGLHHEYVIKAFECGIDVICEKPLTIDEEKCSAIVAAKKKSKADIIVTFNYRYAPTATKIKELIEQGKVGKVVSVDLNWYLDTYHGSSYFQRWNRKREISGGLSVHKACHHFDLVHWWIGQSVEEVFAYGKLNFYGPKGVHNPLSPEQIGDGRTCFTCDVRHKCKYYMRWMREEFRKGQIGEKLDEHLDPRQRYEGYTPRMCIYDPEIDIEDTYSAVIKYDGGAFLNYTLNASVPYEGYRLAINGTEGRIEYTEFHAPDRLSFPDPGEQPIIYIPLFGGREQIDVVNLGGGHGGGDPLILDELFIGPDELCPVKRQAGLEDGIEAVLTGVAVRKSVDEHRVISVTDMKKKVWSAK